MGIFQKASEKIIIAISNNGGELVKKTNYAYCIVFIMFTGLFLSLSVTYAQGTLRERIKARQLEKKQAEKKAKVQALYDKYEEECIACGWRKITVNVNGLERRILWKAPKGNWKNGAIIVLHGGGGTYSNYCANIEIGRPMIEFSNLAIGEGFAVFSLDSEEGFLRDEEGYSCGKRWFSMKEDNKSNPDLDFIEKVTIETIPALRPKVGSKDIFITGISNGGFMAVLAATTFDDKITAFAPVSAGDPYGIYVDCSEGSAFRQTPGKLYDSETNKTINEIGACKADGYPNEKEWNTSYPVKKPLFKLFFHQGDGVCDESCKEKVRQLLIAHGYKDEGSFIIKDAGMRSPLKHFWVSEYNQPLIEFFKRQR